MLKIGTRPLYRDVTATASIPNSSDSKASAGTVISISALQPHNCVNEFLALYDQQYPEEVDLFEDRLARLLGVRRHPATSLSEWRALRVRAIEAAGDEADRLAPEVERYVDLLL